MIKSNQTIYLHPLLKKINGNKILDYRNRTRIDNNPIPQWFNKKIVFQSYNSFQQNSYAISKRLRRKVLSLIKTDSINAIGGESYLYSDNSNYYTNSESCYNDAKYNKTKYIYHIDYNEYKFNILPIDTVINLSSLNVNIMKQINLSVSNRLIIINCHHKDFWKKIKLLDNYKLINRSKFIDYKLKFFVTVNVFIRKCFVSLGGNCSVTYQLNKYNLRNTAYPFDWSEINMNKLIDIFINNFADIEKISIHKFSEFHNNTLIVRNKYMKFAHEIIDKKDISSFKNSLLNRVDRLHNIKNPIFIRIETFNYNDVNTYTNYWKTLIYILNIMYNDYNVILISKINPNIDKIKWIPYSFSSDWRNEHINWINILCR